MTYERRASLMAHPMSATASTNKSGTTYQGIPIPASLRPRAESRNCTPIQQEYTA